MTKGLHIIVMNSEQPTNSFFRPLFLSHILIIPRFPLDARRIDAVLLKRPIIVLAAASLLGLATFYVPEAVAYHDHINEPEIHTATRLNWTMITVGVWVVGTAITWGFTVIGASNCRDLANSLVTHFKSQPNVIASDLRSHRGIGRILAISMLISVGIIVGASFVQDLSLWWKAPIAHIMLAMPHLTLAFFAASYFLLRSLVIEELITRCLSVKEPPPVLWARHGPDLYDKIGRHYLTLAGFAVFAILFLFAIWFGTSKEWSAYEGAIADFGTNVIVPVIPLYLGLVIELIGQPILVQHRVLTRWRDRRLNMIGRGIDQFITSGWAEKAPPTERLTHLITGYQVASASFPSWPLSPRQGKLVVGLTTGLLVPLVATATRSLLG